MQYLQSCEILGFQEYINVSIGTLPCQIIQARKEYFKGNTFIHKSFKSLLISSFVLNIFQVLLTLNFPVLVLAHQGLSP